MHIRMSVLIIVGLLAMHLGWLGLKSAMPAFAAGLTSQPYPPGLTHAMTVAELSAYEAGGFFRGLGAGCLLVMGAIAVAVAAYRTWRETD